MPSPILARADALMHRKRQNDAGSDDVPILTDAISEDDDIPVLLEVAPTQQEAFAPHQEVVKTQPTIATTIPEITPAICTDESVPVYTTPLISIASDATLSKQLATELAHRVEQRLASELPRIIESTLREFLAEQEMIAAASRRD
ncbi:MAG: hypothetical protein KGP14_13330 [Betaproteobacteria bacterium]|nr:hypothetical protein [Betaproteobacteria bacterium]